MKYQGDIKKDTIGNHGHIIDMMSAVLADRLAESEEQNDYCAYEIDHLERECEQCNLCNYGKDCHNNTIS